MKATRKNKTRLAIVIVCAVLFIVPSTAVAEETLLLASLTRTKQAEEFKGFDFFPDYHREARMKEKVQKERKMRVMKEVTVDEKIAQDADWLSKNAIIPYEIITADYVGLIDRVLSR
ncbi:MAG: hypothetical protein JRI61_08535 [Deltaproteobacteria bacterium]|nr:hypothetical protein [Deltaproteobacteria bacterium]